MKIKQIIRLGEGAISMNYDELTPINVLQNGIQIYDRTSFPSRYVKVPTPKEPRIVRADSFSFYVPSVSTTDIGPCTVLSFHGWSRGDEWIEAYGKRRNVGELLDEIGDLGERIDVLLVCNPHGKKLITKEVKDVAYVKSNTSGSIEFLDGNVNGCLEGNPFYFRSEKE